MKYILAAGNADDMNNVIANRQFPAYKILTNCQKSNRLSPKQRQAIQNVYIFTQTNLNPKNLQPAIRHQMYYSSI